MQYLQNLQNPLSPFLVQYRTQALITPRLYVRDSCNAILSGIPDELNRLQTVQYSSACLITRLKCSNKLPPLSSSFTDVLTADQLQNPLAQLSSTCTRLAVSNEMQISSSPALPPSHNGCQHIQLLCPQSLEQAHPTPTPICQSDSLSTFKSSLKNI